MGPDEICRLDPKPKKIIGTSNQPIKTKNNPKKSIFTILKVKKRQKLVWELSDGISSGSLKTIGFKLNSENSYLRRSV
jgi:hypothetical protein